jgi:hypothetical protein
LFGAGIDLYSKFSIKEIHLFFSMSTMGYIGYASEASLHLYALALFLTKPLGEFMSSFSLVSQMKTSKTCG